VRSCQSQNRLSRALTDRSFLGSRSQIPWCGLWLFAGALWSATPPEAVCTDRLTFQQVETYLGTPRQQPLGWPKCASSVRAPGSNRHVVGNERVLQERSSEPS